MLGMSLIVCGCSREEVLDEAFLDVLTILQGSMYF